MITPLLKLLKIFMRIIQLGEKNNLVFGGSNYSWSTKKGTSAV